MKLHMNARKIYIRKPVQIDDILQLLTSTGKLKDLSSPKNIIPEAARVDKSLCLPKLKSINVLLYDFPIVEQAISTFNFEIRLYC